MAFDSPMVSAETDGEDPAGGRTLREHAFGEVWICAGELEANLPALCIGTRRAVEH